jgi:hypothetical protein
MVDMRVRGHDVLGPQLVLGQHFLHAFNLVSWVNHDGLAGLLITHDGTVTGQHSHGKNLVNHLQLSFLSPSTIVLELLRQRRLVFPWLLTPALCSPLIAAFASLTGPRHSSILVSNSEQGARQQMKLVVVGGQARKVGKTSVIAGLIQGLNTLAWTAMKISHHAGAADSQDTPSRDDPPGSAQVRDVGPGLPSTLLTLRLRSASLSNAEGRDGERSRTVAPAQAASRGGPTIDLGHDHLPAHLDFLLTEETDPKGHGDTSLYLAAGARRALWLRARGGRLAPALPGLLEALEGDEHAIIESNSILGFLQPAVFLMVIDESGRDLKASAQQFLERADAFVTVRPDLKPGAWPGTPPEMLEGKPVFPVSPGDWRNPALCRFVGERLASAGEQEETQAHHT